jgi:hypothetical protein
MIIAVHLLQASSKRDDAERVQRGVDEILSAPSGLSEGAFDHVEPPLHGHTPVSMLVWPILCTWRGQGALVLC